MNEQQESCRIWYEQSYFEQKFKAQRMYPNEELCRFLGREYFCRISREERKDIRILEIGCGSCSNLWMIAREGFDGYGLDLSAKAVELGKKMLISWGGINAHIQVASMCQLPYDTDSFDAVIDIFSSYCLCEDDLHICLDEVRRVLKSGEKFFSYTPSTNSDAFKKHKPSEKIDYWTLNGITRKTSPYFGNDYPFRFISPKHYKELLKEYGFNITYLETAGRTYRNMKEYFEWVTIVEEKR